MTKVHVSERMDDSEESVLQGVQELMTRIHNIADNDIAEMLFIIRTKDDVHPDGDVHVGAVGNPLSVLTLLQQTHAELLEQYRDAIARSATNKGEQHD